ncbi:MAG: DUF4124 domain-containing protein [Sulfuritalea sp.]|nr:DUF4124 domain-containing protein [Sulfuritalea sp.]
MTTLRFFLPAVLILPLGVSANTLYKCQGPDGRVTYTNQKLLQQHCEIIAQDRPVSTFTPPQAQRPRQATPADFPRVNDEQQKARDNDRRAILEKELAVEQRNLANARKELAEQENIVLPEERVVGGGINLAKREARIQTHRDKMQLHERNIEAIRRELAKLK